MTDAFGPGQPVEVRKRFDSSWTTGFEVAELTNDGVLLRRRSDGEVLPARFALDDVRPAPPPDPTR